MAHEGHEHGATPSERESHAAKEHKSHAPTQVATYVLTCSDSRSEASDETGSAIQVEVLDQLFEKTLPGFGELFRSLSFQEIGSPAMMSRAMAGTYQGMMIFALPGSPQAVRLALERLILPELGHAVRELTR